ncbi:terminase, partial [Pseudomonas aeruginosa]
KSAGLDHVGDAGGYPIAKRFPVIIQKIFKRRAIAGFSR